MKENILEYKGYHTKVEYIAENNILYGKIEGITDLVTFEASSLDNVEEEFHQAVDNYLSFCEEIGQEPEKEYKGVFNVRIKPDLHRRLSMEAHKEDITMNALIERIINEHYNRPIMKNPNQQQDSNSINLRPDWLGLKSTVRDRTDSAIMIQS